MNLPPPPSSADDSSLANTHPATSSGSRASRLHSPVWNSRQPSRRVLTPISTSAQGHDRPQRLSDSPSRAAFSPTTSSFHHPASSVSRQAPSRQSSTSSSTSLASPTGAGHAIGLFHANNRTRAPTSSGSPRLSSSLANASTASQLAGTSSNSGTAPLRFTKHSPSASISAVGSPTSSSAPHSSGGPGQLTSLLTTQLNILLSTLKESNYESQSGKIKSLVDDNGMEVFVTFFRRLLQSNASAIFPGSTRPQAASENGGQYKLLTEEIAKVSREPHQAEKIAQSLDTNESDLFRDFDLSAFIDHFRLNAIAKVALVLPIRTLSKPDLRLKGTSE